MCFAVFELHCHCLGLPIIPLLLEAKQLFIKSPAQSKEAKEMMFKGAIKKSCDRCGRNFDISEKERRKYEA